MYLCRRKQKRIKKELQKSPSVPLPEYLWKAGKEVQILSEVALRGITTLIDAYKRVWLATGVICFSDSCSDYRSV